jgi:hypothetical protein
MMGASIPTKSRVFFHSVATRCSTRLKTCGRAAKTLVDTMGPRRGPKRVSPTDHGTMTSSAETCRSSSGSNWHWATPMMFAMLLAFVADVALAAPPTAAAEFAPDVTASAVPASTTSPSARASLGAGFFGGGASVGRIVTVRVTALMGAAVVVVVTSGAVVVGAAVEVRTTVVGSVVGILVVDATLVFGAGACVWAVVTGTTCRVRVALSSAASTGVTDTDSVLDSVISAVGVTKRSRRLHSAS